MTDKMTFRNYGGNYQLRIESASDLQQVLELDEALWTATSAPVEGLNCDPAFLKFLDQDCNNRIRTDEIKNALRWTLHILSNQQPMLQSATALQIADIDTSHGEGQKLVAAIRLIHNNLGLAESGQITLEQVRDRKRIMSDGANNGDGVIPPESAPDPQTAQLLQAVIDTLGSAKDAGGKVGVTAELFEQFLSEAQNRLQWLAQGAVPKDNTTNPIQPWGNQTASASLLVESLHEKMQQFFALCDLLQIEPTAASAIGLSESELEAFDTLDQNTIEEYLQRAPLASPNTEGLLDLGGPLNPRFKKALANLGNQTLNRALEADAAVTRITRKDWDKIRATFAAHRTWASEEQGAQLGALSNDQLCQWLDGSLPDQVTALIEADRAVARELDQIGTVEKLILYQRSLLEFINCFVSFPRLYDPEQRSIFEMGTLIIDERRLTFSVKISDRAAHRKIAEHSNLYILYVEISSGMNGADHYEIAVALTTGDSDGLHIGKRGVFFSTDGQEWDAEVVDILDNPVSLEEALKAPFAKVRQFVVNQAEKFNKTQQTKVEKAISKPPSTTAGRDILLAGSLGFAAVGSAFAYITQALAKAGLFNVLGVLLGIALIILGPSLLIGYLKLRKRDLTTLLEASGWAINVRMRLSRGLGELFTYKATLPVSANCESNDLIAHFKRNLGAESVNWIRVVLLAVLFGQILLFLLARFSPEIFIGLFH